MRRRVIVIVLAVAGLAGGAAVVPEWWQAARQGRKIAELRKKLEARAGEPAEHHWLGLRLAERGEQDESLAHLEIAAERDPSNLRFGNDLRLACVRFGRYDSGITFLEGLTEAHPICRSPASSSPSPTSTRCPIT